jgi:cyclopropane fatty-acyl-phospholipid synthase-like methyltransferase
MSEVQKYWNKKSSEKTTFVCPNTSFFRLLGQYYNSLINLNVLEVGFGDGADLRECARRGASVFGLDMSLNYIDLVSESVSCKAKIFEAGKDQIPFIENFDLIYALDMIYYLNDEQLKHFFYQCKGKLKKNGIFITQFIEDDFENPENSVGYSFKVKNFTQFIKKPFFEKNNPIKIVKVEKVHELAKESGLQLVGGKLVIESYDAMEKRVRQNRFFVLKSFQKF